MSYKPAFKIPGQVDLATNGLCFATHEEAKANAEALLDRWTVPTGTDVIWSDSSVNYAWVDGKLVPVVKTDA